MKYDIETFHSDIISLIQTDLPAKLTEISTEKNDGIVLPVVDNTAYLDSIVGQIINNETFVYHGISNIEHISSGPETEMKVSIFVDVIFINDESQYDGNLLKIGLRYNRALREILDVKNSSFRSSKLEIKELIPQDFKLNDEEEVYKACGVVVTANLVG